MLYPLPVVLISTRGNDGKDNLFTVAWTGTVCSDPVMLSISVRPSRYSYQALMDTGVFAVNLTTEHLHLPLTSAASGAVEITTSGLNAVLQRKKLKTYLSLS